MKKFLLILAAMTLFAAPAHAQSAGKKIFINNIDLASYLIADVELKCVTVKFDSKGNIYIIAPGYSFEAAGGTKDPKATTDDEADKANRFYLVSFPKPNKVDTGYDVDLHVNGKFAKRIFGGNEQEVIEITEHFQKGKNEVSFLSVRRKGFTPAKFGGVPFKRVGTERLPIKVLYGPSVAAMLRNREISERFVVRQAIRAREELTRRIFRELDKR